MTFEVPVPLPMVHLGFEALGYLSAVAIFFLRRRRNGDAIDGRTRYVVMLGAGVGAMIGARLLAALCDPSRALEGLAAGQLLFGKTIVGALLGGWIGVELVKRRIGVTTSTGDELVIPIGIGIMIGRIGCFLAGPIDDTAGNPSSLPWALTAADGVKRHPVALYEIAFLVCILALSTVVRKRGIRGDAFKFFLVSYLLFRFAVDFLKPAPPRIYGGVSAIQIACICGLGYYTTVFARRRGGRAFQPLPREQGLAFEPAGLETPVSTGESAR